MPKLPIKTKTLILVGLLLIAMALGHLLTPHIILADTKPRIDFDTSIPKAFSNWRIDPNQPISVPTPELESMLKSLYNQNISRTYVDNLGHHVMLAVAYTRIQTDRTRVHRPEVCYPSQGFEVISQRDEIDTVADHILPVRRMVTRKQDRKEFVTYWVLIGEKVVVSTRDEKVSQIKYGLRLQIPDNLLFRVSSIEENEAEAFARHKSFIKDMMHATDEKVLPHLLGSDHADGRGSA